MDHARKAVAAAGCVLAAAVAVVGGPGAGRSVLLAAALGPGAVLVALLLGRVPRPLPFVLLTAGALCWLAGEVWSEPVRLAGHLLLVLGLGVLARRRTGGAVQPGTLLDAGVVTTGLGMGAWVLLVAPGAGAASTALERAAWAVPFVLDLVLLALTARLLLSAGARSTSSRALGAALGALLGSRVLVTLSQVHAVPWGERAADLALLLGCVLLGVAALHPSVAEPERVTAEPAGPTPGRLLLLAGASLPVPGAQLAAAVTGTDGQPVPTALASALLLALVGLRLSGLAHLARAQSVELTTVVRTDPMTGAANRRGFTERAAALTARPGEDLVLAVLDVDHLRAYNDWHGHAAGDVLLGDCVRGWTDQLRARDHLARWDGDEFVVLLDRCGADEALAVVERLRGSVPPDVTCSAGVAVWDGTESPEELVGRAESALGRARAAGRDRSVLAGRPAAVAVPVQRSVAAPVR